jgi:hypothetical protein
MLVIGTPSPLNTLYLELYVFIRITLPSHSLHTSSAGVTVPHICHLVFYQQLRASNSGETPSQRRQARKSQVQEQNIQVIGYVASLKINSENKMGAVQAAYGA